MRARGRTYGIEMYDHMCTVRYMKLKETDRYHNFMCVHVGCVIGISILIIRNITRRRYCRAVIRVSIDDAI
jgi:hypothetical protein